ncbi:site-specific integrase [Staphylococcus simulans]|nr:site-specific integrase [Staphylococcus simulans]
MYMKEKWNASGVIRYVYYEKYKDPLTNKWREVSIAMNNCTRSFEKEAQRILDQRISEKLNDRKGVELNKLTLHKALDDWFESAVKHDNIKFNTKRGYKYEINAIKRDIDADILIDKVDHHYLQSLLDNWAKTLKYDRVRSHRNRLSSAFKYVENNYEGFEGVKYMKRVKLPNKNTSREAYEARINNFLTEDEQILLMQGLEQLYKANERYEWALTFYSCWKALEIQLLTGMRIGEVIALQYEDIDFKNKEINVNGSLVCMNDPVSKRYGYKDLPKTNASIRKVKATDRIMSILYEMKEKKQHFELLSEFVDRDFIFINKKGNPVSINKVNDTLNRAVKVAGITKHITTHTMRHTHISILSQSGVSLKAIQDRVGHSDANTTLQIYTHVTEQMSANMVNYLENYDKALQQKENDMKKSKLKIVN